MDAEIRGFCQEVSIVNRSTNRLPFPCSRRVFLQTSVGTSAALLAGGTGAADGPASRLAFVQDSPQFSFDTGPLRGALRQGGHSRGLMPLVDVASGNPIAQAYGVFSHYRLLDAQNRYGDAAWSWPSQARLRDDGAVVIAPTAALSSIPYTPEYSMEAMRSFYEHYSGKLFVKYGFYDAFSPEHDWITERYLAIDQGPIVVMIENYRTDMLWDLFMTCPEIQEGLDKLGFYYTK